MPKFVERSENAVTTRTRRLQIALIRDGIGEISSNIYVCMYIYMCVSYELTFSNTLTFQFYFIIWNG